MGKNKEMEKEEDDEDDDDDIYNATGRMTGAML